MAEWVDQHGLTRARHSREAACYEWRSQKWSMITDYDLNSYLFLLFETFINHAYYNWDAKPDHYPKENLLSMTTRSAENPELTTVLYNSFLPFQCGIMHRERPILWVWR